MYPMEMRRFTQAFLVIAKQSLVQTGKTGTVRVAYG